VYKYDFYEDISGAFRYVRGIETAGRTGIIMSIVTFSNPSQTGLIYNNYAAGICWKRVTFYIKCAAAWDIHKVSAEFYWQRLE
jgi:hypothetical protein